jgi:GntP family gluconate:H+ symporter
LQLSHGSFLLLCTAGAIAFLMLLILRAKLHPSVAILVSALTLGVVSGMPLTRISESMATGVGNLLAHVALVLGLGAVLGHLLATSGGAAAVGEEMVSRFGSRGLPLAMMLMGMLVGLPVFFEVGLVLLMPIVVSVAKRSGRSAIVTGMPTLAGLSIVHGLVPPHPAAMLAVTQYHADVGKTILLGLTAGLPAALVAGPIWAWSYEKIQARFGAPGRTTTQAASPAPSLAQELQSDEALLDGAITAGVILRKTRLVPASLFVLLLPVLLIFVGSWAGLFFSPDGKFGVCNAALHLVGEPAVALLIAVLVAQVLLGRICGWSRQQTLRSTGDSFAPIAGVLMILAAAGALSRILNDSGAAQATVALSENIHLSPLLLAWMLAATVRLAIGSATVAMAVTTGILAPVAVGMVAHGGLGPELLVLATGSGSLFCSHVNDPGFWMIKEFFGLEVKETLATWSILETVLSLVGLLCTLLLAAFFLAH